ncbi:MAG: sodium/solute symporter [Planctomycetaceae bacterium]|jgi:SSS family solute:Na+ symporter|nr:sodium/solute symporter [Planctomycetaceae bacterium]
MLVSLPFWLTIVFFSTVIGVAVWGMTRTKNINDFFLGGKTLGPWILAVSYGTAYFSAAAFIGFSGKFGWLFGFHALWIALGNTLIGSLLAWLVLGKPIRRMSHNLNVMTMPEFFAQRYDSQKMQALSAAVIFIFMAPYSASVYQGLSYLFESTFQIKFVYALLAITVISGVYITLGGYQAVARVDFLQGVVMFVGAVLMIVFLVSRFGGLANVLDSVQTKFAERLELHQTNPDNLFGIPKPNFLILAAVTFMTSFGVWGMPQMVHKFYAIKDEKQIVRGAIVTTVFAFFVVGAAYFAGTMCPLLEEKLIVPEGVHTVAYDQLVPKLLSTKLPQVMMAVILLLVLSASISTLTALVLASASAVTIDLYKGYLNPNATSGQMLLLMRILSCFFIFASFVIAVGQISWIVTLMSVSWGAIAGAFLAPFFYGLFWKRATKAGAYCGMFAGLLISNGVFFYFCYAYGDKVAGAYSPLIASVAMIVPFFIVPLISWLTVPPKEEIIRRAFGETEDTQIA